MSFTNLIFLWGLLGLLIPLALHLWNKKPPPIIKVGSTQLFPESNVARMKSISLNNIVLLLLRMLMLGILVLFLMKPFFEKEVSPKTIEKPKHIALVSPDFYHKTTKDFFTKTNKPVHFLLPDFPLASDTIYQEKTNINYWELLGKFDLADSVTLFAPKERFYFNGPKPKLPFHINWKNIPLDEESNVLIAQTNEAEAIHFHSTSAGNYFTSNKANKVINDSLPIWIEPNIGVGFANIKKSKKDLLTKALEVLSQNRAIGFDFTTDSPQWWFYETGSKSNPQANLNFELMDLLSNTKLFQNKINNNHTQLIGDLSSNNEHIGELPLLLESMLPLPFFEQPFDKRQLSDIQVLPDFESSVQALDLPIKEKSFWTIPLWFVLFGLFLLERWMSR